MILREIPNLAGQTEAWEIDLLNVIDTKAQAALRVIRNPEDLKAENDGSYGCQLSNHAADSTLRITAG